MSEDQKCCCSCSCGGSADESDSIKESIKETYGRIAESAKSGQESSCCCGDTSKDAITRDLYTDAEKAGIPVEALLASM